MNPGHIYILQNPSLTETHLKIGRTARDPEERAAEISASTGVPTPFEVAWSSPAADCREAERLLHHALAPYRTNTVREFFELDLDEAIPIAERAIRRSGGRHGGIRAIPSRCGRALWHGLIRPLLRLPAQVLLLALLLAWWLVRGIGALALGIVRVLVPSPPTKRRRRRT